MFLGLGLLGSSGLGLLVSGLLELSGFRLAWGLRLLWTGV